LTGSAKITKEDRHVNNEKELQNCSELSCGVFQKAYRQYESAMGSAAGMGDRLCQMEAMDGAARCLEALRLQQKICNCRPLEFNTRLLEVASSVGAKVSSVEELTIRIAFWVGMNGEGWLSKVLFIDSHKWL
jgi:hypothetical protein